MRPGLVWLVALFLLAVPEAEATDRYYADIKIVSENGRYEFTAVSPDNADPKRPRPFASHFVYTLTDLKTGVILWQRKQSEEFSSPENAYVRDDGWCVVNARPLEFYSPQGALVGSVDILKDGVGEDNFTKYVRRTTAGAMWETFSLWYFVQAGERDCFVIRPWWGTRIICLISRGMLLQEDEGIRLSCETYEREFVLRELRKGIGNRAKWEGDECCCAEVRPVLTAAFWAGKLKVKEAAPLLQQLQKSPYSGLSSLGVGDLSSGTSSIDVNSFRAFTLRQITHLSLRRLAVQPDDSACTELGDYRTPYQIPRRSRPRAENTDAISRGMSPERIVALIGAPDFISQGCWYYDMDAPVPYTLCITWKRGSVTILQREAPPYWGGEKWDALLAE